VADPLLPNGFGDLEAFARDWALPTERERNLQRHRASIVEINAFYEAMLERIDAVMSHLNRFAMDDLPPSEQRLLDLALSLAEVAPAIEFYKQPAVIDGYDSRRFIPRSGQ
jgi:hypothetical protein